MRNTHHQAPPQTNWVRASAGGAQQSVWQASQGLLLPLKFENPRSLCVSVSLDSLDFWMTLLDLGLLKTRPSYESLGWTSKRNASNITLTCFYWQVSLDSRVREVINRNMVEPSQHIFDDAQLQIYTLMHRDSYPRFMNSTVYKDLLQALSEKSVEA